MLFSAALPSHMLDFEEGNKKGSDSNASPTFLITPEYFYGPGSIFIQLASRRQQKPLAGCIHRASDD